MECTSFVCRKRERGINIKKENQNGVTLTIGDKILLGALKCSTEDTKEPFTFEQLVLAAWEIDKNTFGLRGFEEKYPDSHKLHPNVFGGSALIAQGYLHEKDKSLYITNVGLAKAMSLSSLKINTPQRLPKQLQNFVLKILEHPIFRQWLKDPTTPKDFRGAGHFWGISPGTPPKTVRERILSIERTLEQILDFLNSSNLDCIREERVKGKILLERTDIERCLQFHNELKFRFKKELKILDPGGKY